MKVDWNALTKKPSYKEKPTEAFLRLEALRKKYAGKVTFKDARELRDEIGDAWGKRLAKLYDKDVENTNKKRGWNLEIRRDEP